MKAARWTAKAAQSAWWGQKVSRPHSRVAPFLSPPFVPMPLQAVDQVAVVALGLAPVQAEERLVQEALAPVQAEERLVQEAEDRLAQEAEDQLVPIRRVVPRVEVPRVEVPQVEVPRERMVVHPLRCWLALWRPRLPLGSELCSKIVLFVSDYLLALINAIWFRVTYLPEMK